MSYRRGVRVRSNYDGTSTLEITLEEVEVPDCMAALDAFMTSNEVSSSDDPAAEPVTADRPEVAVDESARADDRSCEPQTSWPQRRADAFMEMMRTAIKNAGSGQACGDDRFLVHVISQGEEMTLLDGTPLDQATAARIACDCSSTRLLLGPDWEPLAMGRRTKEWTTAQRRAAIIRDGGQCRFPGCERRSADLHHHQWWVRGGRTDVANGYLACPRHHTLLHAGWTVTGDPNHELEFHRPDGSVLGTSGPRLRSRVRRWQR